MQKLATQAHTQHSKFGWKYLQQTDEPKNTIKGTSRNFQSRHYPRSTSREATLASAINLSKLIQTRLFIFLQPRGHVHPSELRISRITTTNFPNPISHLCHQ